MSDAKKCEPFGGSDYCYYCGKDICTSDGMPRDCESRRLPPKVIAFGCDKETNGGECCDVWCGNRVTCPVAVTSRENKE